MKRISYRGGLVGFQIPSHWVEECGDEGGGTFYEDSPDSSTLRLNVMSFEIGGGDPLAAAQNATGDERPVALGPAAYLYGPLEKSVEEEGENLLMLSWKVAFPVFPNKVRMAIFTYTILERQRDDSDIVQEIEMIEKSIRTASYSCEPGCSGPAEKH